MFWPWHNIFYCFTDIPGTASSKHGNVVNPMMKLPFSGWIMNLIYADFGDGLLLGPTALPNFTLSMSRIQVCIGSISCTRWWSFVHTSDCIPIPENTLVGNDYIAVVISTWLLVVFTRNVIGNRGWGRVWGCHKLMDVAYQCLPKHWKQKQPTSILDICTQNSWSQFRTIASQLSSLRSWQGRHVGEGICFSHPNIDKNHFHSLLQL